MNPYRAEVTVTLGGKEHVLVYDYNALCELEELYNGKSITAIFGLGDKKRLAESLGPSLVRKALFVGLKRRHKGMSLEKIGDLMSVNPRGLGDLLGAVTKGLMLAMFGPDGPTKQDDTDAQAAIDEFKEDPTSATADSDSTGNG